MSDILPMFPKPYQREGKITMTKKQRAERRLVLFQQQKGFCADCGNRMTLTPDMMNTATLDHVFPEKMGQKKRDNPDNHRVVCWGCNMKKGSKRI